MPGLFIAGTGTDVGKTYVTKALIRALLTRGRAVDALKPVVSGFDPAEPQASDPAVLL
jgi:dethiobiotin synthetase